MTNRLLLGAAAGLLALAAITSACGSDDSKETSSSPATPQASAAATSAAVAPASSPASSPAAAATTNAPQAVSVKAGEYFFDPKDIKVRPGQIVVTMTNDGPERPHTFVVKNKSGNGDIVKADRIDPGKNVTVEFSVTEEGTYEVYCNLPGHADRGQRGTLTVSRT